MGLGLEIAITTSAVVLPVRVAVSRDSSALLSTVYLQKVSSVVMLLYVVLYLAKHRVPNSVSQTKAANCVVSLTPKS